MPIIVWSVSALITLTRSAHGRLIAAGSLQALAGVCSVVPMMLAAAIAESLLAGNGPRWGLVSAMAITLLIRAMALAGATTVAHLADNDLQLTLRRRLTDHLGRVHLDWFTRTPASTVKRAATDDVGALHHLVAHAWLDVVGALSVPVAGIAYLLWRAPLLGMIALVPAVIGLVIQIHHNRTLGPKMAHYQRATAELDRAATEYVENVQVVKVFGRSGSAHSRFDAAVGDHGAFVQRWAKEVGGAMTAVEILLSPLLAAAVAVVAGALLGLPVAAVIAVALVAPGLSAPALALAFAMQDISAGRRAAERLMEVLGTRTDERPQDGNWPRRRPRIRLEDVTVVSDDRVLLAGVSATIEPGTQLAIVGPSGAGKTTLLKTLCGLRAPDSGRVLIDDVDLADIPLEQVGAHIGHVSQDVGIIRGSVTENVMLGHEDADPDAIADALRKAQLWDRVEELPEGLDTVIGEDTTFSGGERQRLALARAFFSTPGTLLLDEPTAFADLESEALIDAALADAPRNAVNTMGERPTVVRIDHRLGFAHDADVVWVLEDGHLVQAGTPGDLASDPTGRFAALRQAREVTA